MIRIEGVDDAAVAQTYAGAILSADRAAVDLDPGEYLDDDLVGCEVGAADGRRFGAVRRVEHYPSSDILVLDGGMIPMVAAIVLLVDLDRRYIEIDPPAGLLDED